ncbi:NACHT domain-containing protein [Roseofilum sp. BLCC_M143]|uniref:NACHT domain-containing protein n=1 Tax=Roseofilum casamattae BLCC-M143 TaxID=3022442 RepID=A0ABT7BSN7_9CYAN|nr:NACHT domain-containing protein [Roseofilum casamattae]MDJ1182204.1 NACHT domain-containing protein [Roseofilum casamattae BLCC-M143]
MIGEPGAGKTTRLQKIADWILDEHLGLPIWISLKDLTKPTLTHHIEDIWLKHTGKSLTLEALREHEERIWLLLDGLDEMTSRADTDHVSQLLGGWVRQTRVIMTCRVNVWEADKNAFSGFDVFRNLELKPEQVNGYIRNWFAKINYAARGEQLQQDLQKSDNTRLLELIRNPLRLWMLCQIWQPEQGLPETQAELYEQFVEWVYTWKADDDILRQRQEIDSALANLALAAMEQPDDASRFQLRESWILEVLSSRTILPAIKQLGWLNCLQRGTDTIYGFYHATFQEYFAALAVQDWDYFLPQYLIPGKEYRIFMPQWKQVILLWLGRKDVEELKKEAFIQQLVNFDDGCGEWNFEKVDRGFYSYRAYFLAAAGMSEFNSCSLAKEIVQYICQWRFGYWDIEKQKWLNFKTNQVETRQALWQSDRQIVIQTLEDLTCSQNYPEHIHLQVLNFIGKIDPGNVYTINALISIIETNNNWQAISVLGEVAQGTRNQNAISVLMKILNRNGNEFFNEMAAKSLGKIDPGNPKSISTIISLLASNQYRPSRHFLINILMEIGKEDRAAKNTLLSIMKTDRDSGICYRAAQGMLNIDPDNQEAKIIVNSYIKNIESQSQDRLDFELQEIGSDDEIDLNIREINNAQFTWNLRNPIEYLGSLGRKNGQRIQSLMYLLNFSNRENILQEVINVVERLIQDNEKVTDNLTDLYLKYEDPEICLWTAGSLGDIGLANHDIMLTLNSMYSLEKMQAWENSVTQSIEKISKINQSIFWALIDILKTKRCQPYTSIGCLTAIINTDQQRKNVISTLKPYLTSQTYNNNIDFFEQCYKLLCDITQTLSYSDFYQVWHGSLPSPIHLAKFPQLLHAALPEGYPWQLLIIDRSKANRDNPVKNLYRQMLQQGCPKSEDGKPNDMADLQDYWEDLCDNSNNSLALIFYENPQTAEPQGFSDPFLDALSRFDGKVCVVTEQHHPHLQTFSPENPRLIEHILKWLKSAQN